MHGPTSLLLAHDCFEIARLLKTETGRTNCCTYYFRRGGENLHVKLFNVLLSNWRKSISCGASFLKANRVASCFHLIYGKPTFCHCTNFLLLLSAGFEAQTRIKRPRALPAEEEPENYVDQEDLEERNNPLSPNYVPPGFLSPSVQEYLELGKSIPGKFNYQSSHPLLQEKKIHCSHEFIKNFGLFVLDAIKYKNTLNSCDYNR